MRLSNAQAVARPSAEDRNPIARNNSYGITSLAPHVLTTRWSYTVPAGRKCRVGFAFAEVIEDAVATTPSTVHSFVNYIPSGGASSFLTDAAIWASAIGVSSIQGLAAQFWMLPGDVIQGQTQNNAIGGTVQHGIAWAGTEADA